MKKILAVVIAICLLSFCAACTSFEPSNNPNQEATAAYYPLGQVVNIDLNGDGTTEEVYYGLDDFTINGVSYKDLITIDVYEDNPFDDNFIIADINQSDQQKEIGLQVMGPSSDLAIYFYAFDGETLTNIGYIPSGIEDLDAAFDGQGNIQGSLRLEILQTWWAPATWQLKEGRITLQEQELYYPIPADREFTLTTDLPVYASMDDPGPTTIIPAQKVKLPATDNKNWVQVTAQDGNSGWMYIQSDTFMYITALNVDATEVFSDLVMAD